MDSKLPEQLNIFNHHCDEKGNNPNRFNHGLNHGFCNNTKGNSVNKLIHMGSYYSQEKKEKVEQLANRLTSHLL